MAAPFPEAQFESLIYVAIGVLLGLVIFSSIYIRRLHRVLEQHQQDEEQDLRTDNIGLSRRAEELLDQVLETPELQSELPSELEVSKATVSNAVSELNDRGLIKRKKKANTYLIEPHRDRLEKEQR